MRATGLFISLFHFNYNIIFSRPSSPFNCKNFSKQVMLLSLSYLLFNIPSFSSNLSQHEVNIGKSEESKVQGENKNPLGRTMY